MTGSRGDPGELRARMVGTLRDRGIFHDVVIERAFDQVPREAFLPGVAIEQVYSGHMIPTKHDTSGSLVSSSSEVGVMASMIEMCELAPGHRVLEIGAGTGYNAAILATVVGERGEVTTVDIDAACVQEARDHLATAGLNRVSVVDADGWYGHAKRAPTGMTTTPRYGSLRRPPAARSWSQASP